MPTRAERTSVRCKPRPARGPRKNWPLRFQQLAAFKEKHGHCNVPKNYPANPQLANWVKHLRQERLAGRLDAARVRDLDRIGFRWSHPARSNWPQWLKELGKFKAKHGHTNVPHAWPENRQLANWVMNLRARKRAGTLDEDTIRRLEGLGFQWALRHRRVHRWDWDLAMRLLPREVKKGQTRRGWLGTRDRNLIQSLRRQISEGRFTSRQVKYLERLGIRVDTAEARWCRSYARLVKYNKTHGHCNVPYQWPEDRELANWVCVQRHAKRRGTLPREKVRQLDAVGFSWSRAAPDWETMYARLAEYQRIHGQCRVPTTQNGLGNWVRRQRVARRGARLSEERIRLLDGLGFTWNCRRR